MTPLLFQTCAWRGGFREGEPQSGTGLLALLSFLWGPEVIVVPEGLHVFALAEDDGVREADTESLVTGGVVNNCQFEAQDCWTVTHQRV